MPIALVEIVGEPAHRDGLAQRLADAIGDTLGSQPQGTWVKLRVIPTDDFAENGGGDPGVAPVFVSILRREPPTGDDLRTEIAALTTAVADTCARPPGNVHITYRPAAAGRQAFGGNLVE